MKITPSSSLISGLKAVVTVLISLLATGEFTNFHITGRDAFLIALITYVVKSVWKQADLHLYWKKNGGEIPLIK